MGKADLRAEEMSAARDFVMARLAACRARLAAAAVQLDVCLAHFVDPSEDDKKGKERAGLLEQIDEDIGDAAIALHAAQEIWPEVDPSEGEPEPEEEDDEDEDEGEDDEDEE